MKIAILNGLLVSPSEKKPRKGNLYIADGFIIAHDKAPAHFNADVTIDASEQWVCPGLIDLSAAPETTVAAQRGITLICCKPSPTNPLDTPSDALALQQLALNWGQARVVTLGALTQQLLGQQLAPMAALKEANCVGVSNGKQAIADTRVLYNAFSYAASYNLTVHLFANDPWLLQNGCAHDANVSARLGLSAIPACCETIGVSRAIHLQKATGVKLHLCRISCAESVALIARAQQEGQAITADVAAHHLYLSDLDLDTFNSNFHVLPPLRSVADQEALLNGIKKGVISAVCSDHEPQELADKLQPFPHSVPGISGLDTLLPLVIGLCEKISLTPNEAIKLVTENPANILDVALGSLNVQTPADICIINPNTTWKLTPETLLSRGKNSPFLDWPLQGLVTHTIIGGELVTPQNTV